jgi:hypothetical protein
MQLLVMAVLCQVEVAEIHASGTSQPSPTEAESSYRQALLHQPDSLAALTGLTKFLTQQERFAEAADGWEKVARLDPGSGSAWANRGVMLIRSNNEESPARAHDAVSCFHRAQVLEPSNPQRQAFLEKAVTWRSQILASAKAKGVHDECGDDDELVRQKTSLAFMRCSDAVMFGACDDVLLPKAASAQDTFNVKHECPLACGLCPDHYPPAKSLKHERTAAELDNKVDGVKIAGFMHVGTFGQWKSLVGQQLTKLVESGLYGMVEQISVGVVGGDEWEAPAELPKISVAARVSDASAYEVPTLTKLHQYCQQNEDHFVFYIHSKGATSMEIQDPDVADPSAVWDWREYMEYFVIERHMDCVQALKAGSNTCGVNYSPQPPHYSGNFWWARCSCVAGLPPLESHDRLLAEKWLLQPSGGCLARKKVRNMWYSGLYDNERGSGHYVTRYPPSRYVNSTCSHFSCEDPPIPNQH